MMTVGEPSRGVTYQGMLGARRVPVTRSNRKSGSKQRSRLKVWRKDGLSDTVSAQAWNFAIFSFLDCDPIPEVDRGLAPKQKALFRMLLLIELPAAFLGKYLAKPVAKIAIALCLAGV